MSTLAASDSDRAAPEPGALAARAPDGLLALEFARGREGRTLLRSCRQRFPLRTTVPFHLDGGAPEMAFIYVQNPTGGIFAGDRLLTSVTAGRGTRIHLTTQSASKLYRTDGAEARQKLEFRLDAEAYLESIPDPLIPQAGARYRQRTVVELDPSASFVGAETLAPGRRAQGERFAYELLEVRTKVLCEGREVCADSIRLEPRRAAPTRRGVLGDADYLVSLLVVAPERDASLLADTIDRALAAAHDFRGAAGELPCGAGAVARILAPDAVLADRALRCAWGAARRVLLGLALPERRK